MNSQEWGFEPSTRALGRRRSPGDPAAHWQACDRAAGCRGGRGGFTGRAAAST